MILHRLGVFFYLVFANFIAQFLNDGQKMLSTRFCPSFNANLGATPNFHNALLLIYGSTPPKFSVAPKIT